MPDLIGLIPAAGKGLRLGLPYPKELYPVIQDNRYKPVAQFVLETLTAAGLRHMVFVVNASKHQLIGYFGDGSRFGCHLSYVVQEHCAESSSEQCSEHRSAHRSTSPGLAHALDSAFHLTRGKTVCFGMPDTLMTPRDVFHRLLDAARPDDDVLLGLFDARRPEKSGMVDLDAAGRVIRIVDKPACTTLRLMWGLIVWRPVFTEYLHASGSSDFASIMNAAIQAGIRFRGVYLGGAYTDLGTYADILELECRFPKF